jgi:hypothetical protein
MKVLDRVFQYFGRKKEPKAMPNFVVEEESSDLFWLILGVGGLGEQVALAVGTRPLNPTRQRALHEARITWVAQQQVIATRSQRNGRVYLCQE